MSFGIIGKKINDEGIFVSDGNNLNRQPVNLLINVSDILNYLIFKGNKYEKEIKDKKKESEKCFIQKNLNFNSKHDRMLIEKKNNEKLKEKLNINRINLKKENKCNRENISVNNENKKNLINKNLTNKANKSVDKIKKKQIIKKIDDKINSDIFLFDNFEGEIEKNYKKLMLKTKPEDNFLFLDAILETKKKEYEKIEKENKDQTIEKDIYNFSNLLNEGNNTYLLNEKDEFFQMIMNENMESLMKKEQLYFN